MNRPLGTSEVPTLKISRPLFRSFARSLSRSRTRGRLSFAAASSREPTFAAPQTRARAPHASTTRFHPTTRSTLASTRSRRADRTASSQDKRTSVNRSLPFVAHHGDVASVRLAHETPVPVRQGEVQQRRQLRVDGASVDTVATPHRVYRRTRRAFPWSRPRRVKASGSSKRTPRFSRRRRFHARKNPRSFPSSLERITARSATMRLDAACELSKPASR